MKARRSNMKVTPHGGVVPILKLLKDCGIPQTIRNSFDKRPHWSSYENDDVFISLILTIICGGTRLDHITKLKKKLEVIPGLKVPSHDTLGRVLKKLATKTDCKRNISKKAKGKISFTHYSDNLPLNELLVKCTKKMGLFQKGRKYTLDVDATFVPTKSKEARKASGLKNIKQNYGHAPLVCLIDNLPVYMSLRSGNASPAFGLQSSLAESIDILEKNNISIGRVRSDAAGQVTEMLEMLHSRGIKFNVRKIFYYKNAQLTNGLKNSCWSPVKIKTFDTTWNCEITDFPYFMHGSEMPCRIVALRIPDKRTTKLMETPENNYKLDKGFDAVKSIILPEIDNHELKNENDGWVNYEGYDYKLIITNDLTSHPKSLILEYNKRGGSERNFSYLKQNCGWRIPPFMRLNENAVFLIVAALANNIFRASVIAFKEHVPGIYINCTLKTFQFIFVDVACAVKKNVFVFYSTDIAFEKIC